MWFVAEVTYREKSGRGQTGSQPRKYDVCTVQLGSMSQTDETKETSRDGMKQETDDGEYVAVLRDLEPAGTAEFAEQFNVTQGTARRRLEGLRERNASVDSKKIGGSYVWFVNESELDADAAATAEKIRRRMGVKEG